MKNENNSLEYVKKLINENNNEKALEILNHNSDKSIWAQNARAVCLMRLNSPANAAKVLTPIIFKSGSIIINSEVPEKIKLNLVEAMLLIGNVAGAVNLIENCQDDCPTRTKLKAAIKKWEKSLPIWSRFMIFLGILPFDKPITIEHPYGEL